MIEDLWGLGFLKVEGFRPYKVCELTLQSFQACARQPGSAVSQTHGTGRTRPEEEELFDSGRVQSAEKPALEASPGHSQSSCAEPTVQGQGASLLLREQVCFQEVAALTQKGARKWLLKAGVLRPSGHKNCFHCWHCSTAMEAGDSKGRSLRCPNSRCKVRARLDDTEYAFTAFSGYAAAGCDLDFVRFIRTAYCLGLKMSNDQTMHVCRLPDENPKSALSYVGTRFRRHKLALAFSEASLSKEADSGSLSSKRTSEGRQHGARLLAVKGRLSKRWTVTALNLP